MSAHLRLLLAAVIVATLSLEINDWDSEPGHEHKEDFTVCMDRICTAICAHADDSKVEDCYDACRADTTICEDR